MNPLDEGFEGRFTYLGLDVPAYVFRMSENERHGWRVGVTYALDQKAHEEKPKRTPRVLQRGDEIPADVTAVRVRDYGHVAYRFREGWLYGSDRADAEEDAGSEWTDFETWECPLTEVFE